MGRPRRRGRDIHGVLLLDKPRGRSSNDVLQQVKRLYNANKAGHTGALDPLATGMLPICLGEATKFSRYLLDADKRYRVIARLGERTDTSDAHGQIVQTRPIAFTDAVLQSALAGLRGATLQIPSMYSALKHQGRPLYEYARQGITIERVPRPISIFELKFIRYEGNELELEIHCSKGTYIRTIIDDLGEQLGCGAHVIMLRRLQVSTYPLERMISLDELYRISDQALESNAVPATLLDPLLLPMDSPAYAYPKVILTDLLASCFRLGQAVQLDGAPKEGLVRVIEGQQQQFIGMGEIDTQGRIAPKRIVVGGSV